MADSMLEESAFTVRPQVTTLPERPCTIYQEISFRKPIQLECIKFRNFYCASVTIKQLLSEAVPEGYELRLSDSPISVSNNEQGWKTILDEYKLMEDPHYENDAQHFHTIRASQLNANFVRSPSVKALRFYLEQPSPNWRSFGLRDLMCYTLKKTPKAESPEPDRDNPDPELASRVDLLMETRARIEETLAPFLTNERVDPSGST